MLPSRVPAPTRRRPSAAVLGTVGTCLLAVAAALLGATAAAHGTGELGIPSAGTATLLRTVLFGALAVHLGALAATALSRTLPGRPESAPRGWTAAASVAGALAAAGQIVRLARISDLGLVETYGTREGGLLLLTANGFALAACCAVSRRPALAAAPLALVVGAEALRAHPEAYSPAVGAALTAVHLTAASLWCGGLLHVLRTMRLWRRTAPVAARALLGRYARLAGLLYAALTVTGTCSALRRLPPDVVLTSAYGRTLLAKLVLMAVASALALGARRRLVSDADPAAAHRRARRELVAPAAVVLVSAVLTVVPDPHWLSTR